MGGKEVNDLEATELRLGLPGTQDEGENQNIPATSLTNNKRSLVDTDRDCAEEVAPPNSKAKVVGWPPVRGYRKNCMESKKREVFVKVSMDGAPYLRKIDLTVYKEYPQLLQGLQNMFNFKLGTYSGREGYNGSEYVPTYEDKDGDWMLVGDVPWDMFSGSCKRLRIMKASEAKGLGCVEPI